MAYTPEFRRRAVQAVLDGASAASVGRALGIDKDHICKWKADPERWLVDKTEAILKKHFSSEEIAGKVDAPSVRSNADLASQVKTEGLFSSVVLVIPDMHCPWEHPDALEFLRAVKRKFKPTHIVNLGDEVDFYGMSRFEHDPDVVNPGGELSLAVKHLLPFYREFPNTLVCQSNHTHRVHAKAQKSGLPASTVKSIEEILKTPEGWIYKYCHTIDGVDYKHGTGKSGANAHVNHAKATGRSTCIGHIHAHAGVNYLRYGLFAANFGCLIDKKAPCFAYASDMDDNVVLGCGLVLGGKEAYFIPMHVDANNRWTGKLHA